MKTPSSFARTKSAPSGFPAFGGGFHPDTRGKDCTPEMSAEEISEYDRDMDELFRIAGNPYAFAIAAGGIDA